MLAVGIPSKPHSRTSADGSHESGCGSRSDDDASDFTHARKSSRVTNSNSIAQGLAVAALVAEASLHPPEGPGSRPKSVTNLSGVTNQENNQTRNRETQELPAPPPPEKRPGHPRLATLPPLNFNHKSMAQEEGGTLRFSPSVTVRPPPFPILELPALPTPSVDSSAEPQSRSGRGAPRLNSMPTLPMQGGDERENDPDHENCTLDEDEEGDDEENEDDGAGEGGGSEDEDEDADSGGRSPTTIASPFLTSKFFSATRVLSPRLPMPSLPSPGFATLFGTVVGGTSANSSNTDARSASGSAEDDNTRTDEMATPKIGRRSSLIGNGSAFLDYFSTSNASGPAANSGVHQYSAPAHIDPSRESSPSSQFSYPPLHPPLVPPVASSSSTTLDTPTARDYPAFRTPMVSVAPSLSVWSQSDSSDMRPFKDNLTSVGGAVNVPHLSAANSLSSRRPNIYHHASRSMIELFSAASAAPKRDVDTNFAGSVEIGRAHV